MRVMAKFIALCVVALVAFAISLNAGAAELRTETFDRDPGWDGSNNRTDAFPKRIIEQDFGYAADVRSDSVERGHEDGFPFSWE